MTNFEKSNFLLSKKGGSSKAPAKQYWSPFIFGKIVSTANDF